MSQAPPPGPEPLPPAAIPPGERALAGAASRPLRFPRSARLARSSEFLRVKTQGRSVHGRFMVLGVYRDARDPAGPSRVGFITSRRVGNAVVRNRARRRLREIIRVERPRLHPGLWIVIVAKAAIARADPAELKAEYLALGGRAAIFRAS